MAAPTWDVQAQQRAVSTRTERFKVDKGRPAIPVVPLLHPEEGRFSTDKIGQHILDLGPGDRSGKRFHYVPCAKILTGGHCPVCALGELVSQEEGGSDYLTDELRDFLMPRQRFILQIVDLRDKMPVVGAYQAAYGTRDPQQINAALANLRDAIVDAPVKEWHPSQTLYNLIMQRFDEYQTRIGGKDMQGNWTDAAVDPFNKDDARLLWVSRANDNVGRYDVQFGWELPIQVPEEVYGPGYTKLGEIFDQKVRQLAKWDQQRVGELLAGSGINIACLGPASPMNYGAIDVGPPPVPAVPQLPPRPAHVVPPTPANMGPASYTTTGAPAPQPVAPPPQASPPATPPPAVPQPAVIAPVQPRPPVQAGDTVSASRPTCFGQGPNFQKQTCVACAVINDCLEKAKEKQLKQTAPAMAPAVAPPQAASDDDTAAKVNAEVDAALAAVDALTGGDA